jgi:hypothetical protein
MTPLSSLSTVYFFPWGTSIVVSSLSMMAGPLTILPQVSFDWAYIAVRAAPSFQ